MNPYVVVLRVNGEKDEFCSEQQKGRFYRLLVDGLDPCAGRIVNCLRLLDSGTDKFAFAGGGGHGICLSELGLLKLERMLGIEE